MSPWRVGSWSWVGRILGSLIAFSAIMAAISLVVLDPLAVALAQGLVALHGQPFAGDFDLVPFFLSPAGLLTALVIVGAFVVLTAIEFGGLTLITLNGLIRQRTSLSSVTRRLTVRLPALLVLTGLVCLAAFVLLIPVGLAALVAKKLWLSDGDIYFFVSTRPREFYYAVLLVGGVMLLAGLLGVVLVLRWFLAVPYCVAMGVSATAALEWSAAATTGHRGRLLLRIATWAAIALLLSVAATAGFTVLFDHIALERTLEGATRNTLLLAIAAAVLATLVSAVIRALFAVLAVDLYARSGGVRIAEPSESPRTPRRVLATWLLCLSVPAVATLQTVWALEAFDLDDRIDVTAHRAGSSMAPENTLAALDKAIAARADFAEIDVQETRDGEIVVLHDTDLRRVAGVARSVWDISYDEIRQLDVGSWFSPAFRDERIPTLRELALRSKGRIRLNVELKVNGHGVDLASRTLTILKETGVADTAVVSSFDQPILAEVRQKEPAIVIGFIVASGVGNLTALNVDFYSLSARLVTPALIRRITETGRKAHAWGLNSDAAIIDAVLDGITNVSTDDPALARRTVDALQEMNAAEIALLRLRRTFERQGLLRRAAVAATQPVAAERSDRSSRASAANPATSISSARRVGSIPAASRAATGSRKSDFRLCLNIFRRWPNAACVTCSSERMRQGSGSARGTRWTTEDVTLGGGTNADGATSNRIFASVRQPASTPSRP